MYNFSVAVPGSTFWQEVDWNMLPEADENRAKDARGCCAEALVFIQGLKFRESGLFQRLESELGLNRRGSESEPESSKKSGKGPNLPGKSQ